MTNPVPSAVRSPLAAGALVLLALPLRADLHDGNQGLLLTAGLLWGSHAWLLTLASGKEVCGRCGVERDAARYGWVWTYSEARPSRSPAWIEAGVAPCADHAWKRTSCWRLDGGYRYLAPVRP